MWIFQSNWDTYFQKGMFVNNFPKVFLHAVSTALEIVVQKSQRQTKPGLEGGKNKK